MPTYSNGSPYLAGDPAAGPRNPKVGKSAITPIIGVSDIVRMLIECGRPKIAPDP
jgi:hypothetical protein